MCPEPLPEGPDTYRNTTRDGEIPCDVSHLLLLLLYILTQPCPPVSSKLPTRM